MARRIVIETPCDHGMMNPHWIGHPQRKFDCPGGSRRVLDPGSFVLIERQGSIWPKHANDALLHWATTDRAVTPDDLWDALAGGEQS